MKKKLIMTCRYCGALFERMTYVLADGTPWMTTSCRPCDLDHARLTHLRRASELDEQHRRSLQAQVKSQTRLAAKLKARKAQERTP